ncbi:MULTISPECIES: hypothetical protein [unclassified Roseitalea]|uniref:hypothetical protein n=1 Tax=unclassified Roseitalea TaxID=2639107 RepID=UPI00273DA91D|nr:MULTISPECIES: hypothetical protein [unclassified Roseitalea]
MLQRLALSFLVLGAALSAIPSAQADTTRDAKFFQKIEGKWRGPGEIVAGKYKGTKFICEFDGATPAADIGMSLDGGCRVGVFTQKMSASVRRQGRSYRGTFLDGADGEGLDVTAGNVSTDRVALTLNRNDLKGAMLARLADQDTLNITVSVHVGDELVPVIGMSLDRLDGVRVGSID